MSKKYIVVKGIDLQDANAESSYLTTAISTSAYLGFLNGFKNYLNEKFKEAGSGVLLKKVSPVDIHEEDGIMPVFHSVAFSKGAKGIPYTLYKDKNIANGNFAPPTHQLREKHYNADLSLVLEISVSDKHELSSKEDKLKEHFLNYLKSARLGGGKLTNLNQLLSFQDEKIAVFSSLKEVNKFLGSCKGWFIKNENDFFEMVAQESSKEQAIYDFLFIFRDEESKENYKKQKGWYFLNLIGYKKLEEPTHKKNARKGYKHFYAEPIIGMNKLEYFRYVDESFFLKWESSDNKILIKNKGDVL